MPLKLTRTEWELIFDKILNNTKDHLNEISREDFHNINNERFYHHQFTSLLYKHFLDQGIDIWKRHLLIPEAKTHRSFIWKEVNLNDIELTKREAINKGSKGNYDFLIETDNKIYIEWKGPWIYSQMDIAQVMLKLFSQNEEHNNIVRIFAAIIASSKTGKRNHISKIYKHFIEGLKFSLNVLDIRDIETREFYVYIATLTDNEIIKCYWGHFNNLIRQFENIICLTS